MYHPNNPTSRSQHRVSITLRSRQRLIAKRECKAGVVPLDAYRLRTLWDGLCAEEIPVIVGGEISRA